MENNIASIAATDQSEKRFRGCKMNFKFAAVARNNSDSIPFFMEYSPTISLRENGWVFYGFIINASK
jgi:hypothetical protein